MSENSHTCFQGERIAILETNQKNVAEIVKRVEAKVDKLDEKIDNLITHLDTVYAKDKDVKKIQCDVEDLKAYKWKSVGFLAFLVAAFEYMFRFILK
jgi:predicted RNase H-like nuclease (RuvC/YqgF family)